MEEQVVVDKALWYKDMVPVVVAKIRLREGQILFAISSKPSSNCYFNSAALSGFGFISC